MSYLNNSLPGTSGLLSPYNKMKGLYFNDDNEPDDFLLEFKKSIKELAEKNGKYYIDISYDDREEYNKIMDKIVEFNNDKIKVFGTSINKIRISIEGENGEELNIEPEDQMYVDIEEDDEVDV